MPLPSTRIRESRPAVLALVIAVVAVCNGGAAAVDGRRSHQPPAISDARDLSGTGTPGRQCVAEVSALIKLTPDSWGYGLRQGVSDSLLVARYGARSRAVQTFRSAQSRLLQLLRTEGYRKTGSKLRRVAPMIQRGCNTP